MRNADLNVHSPNLDRFTLSLRRPPEYLLKAVLDLTTIVKQLREDIGHQRTEIGHLRQLIENCAGCRETVTPAPPPALLRESCHTHNPCYPGVRCHDTSSGMRCDHCPRGLVGNGKQCKPGVVCADRPCFQ